MLKLSHLLLWLSALMVGMTVELVGFQFWELGAWSARPGPQSMDEVIRVADKLGLYWRSDRGDGVVTGRIVISAWPVTYTAANNIRFGAPDHPCWRRTVAVCFPACDVLANHDPDCSAFWGRTMLYGDPELIRALTGEN